MTWQEDQDAKGCAWILGLILLAALLCWIMPDRKPDDVKKQDQPQSQIKATK